MVEAADEFTELLDRLRQGDDSVLALLVTRYEGVVRRTAHALLGPALRPHLDSVDVVQSVHRSLLIGLRHQKFHFATAEQLVALALTMVRRKVARHWRNVQRQPGAGNSLPVSNDSVETLSQLGDTSQDPAQILQSRDEVRQLLDGLDDLDRRLLELRVEGHSTAEAAQLLGVAPGLLRVRLTRLRKRLRKQGLLDEWL
jgi:RNA polymerase sigma-70 factor (ECF subfamily)